jgi:hypothetical protein
MYDDNISQVSFSPIGRRDESIELVPMFIQYDINLILIPIWFESFEASLWHPAALIFPIQGAGHQIPIDGIPFGSDISPYETIAFPGRS